jgi:niacin transporter
MKTKEITITALFIAIGIVLPQLFHLFGGPELGKILLPMHIPVLLGGLLLGPRNGILIGIVSVLAGFMLGMPTFPIMPFMVIELGIYGFATGYLVKKNVPVYPALLSAMIIGRVVSMLAMILSVQVLGITLPPVFGTVALFIPGIPGMILQIVLIPILYYLLKERYNENIQTV